MSRVSGATGVPQFGARLEKHGEHTSTQFRVAAPSASAMFLCLFDGQGRERRVSMQRDESGTWFAQRDDCPEGTRYGFRADGPFEPASGLWCNPAKLLVDPYARQIDGDLNWAAPVFEPDAAVGRRSAADSAEHVPRSVVVDNDFDWQGDSAPGVPWPDTVVYELHVKGFTRLHGDVPDELRGKYLGLAQPPVINYLKRLGITSVQLLPTAAFLSEHHLAQKGLSNYWGYNPIALFAPHAAYAVANPVAEFKTMVRELHAAGIEVILDIVLNHTAEADHSGPVLSMRGLDNAAWYRLVEDAPGFYENFSGCGNSINTAHPRTLAFTLSCLRYWVETMHVDGFRFDLAASLGRDEKGHFNPEGEFFQRVKNDPVLSGTKLIAEPWDVGPHGYQLGNFPAPWRECNGGYRDEVRAFWNHRSANTGAFAERIAGSSDMYRHPGRAPSSSINFVTCHDGFTLRDLVSFERKHNESNGEDNRDGNNYNLSANHGIEGISDEPQIASLRRRQQQNFLATLILSQGVPHILAGDELGHSQVGNNNAYCQDNEITWIDWRSPDFDNELLQFVTRLLQIRRRHPALRRAAFLTGEPPPGQTHISAIKDVAWLHYSGREMTAGDWHDPHLHSLGMLLLEHSTAETVSTGYAHLLLFNSGLKAVEFSLPDATPKGAWTRLFDTAENSPTLPFTSKSYRLGSRACAAFSEPFKAQNQ